MGIHMLNVFITKEKKQNKNGWACMFGINGSLYDTDHDDFFVSDDFIFQTHQVECIITSWSSRYVNYASVK